MTGIAPAPEPQILPPNTEGVQPQPAAPTDSTPQQSPPPYKKRSVLPWIIVGVVILLIFLGLMMVASTPTETPVQVNPTPSIMMTPIPAVTKTLSPFATESAFLEFEIQLDTVTRGIQNAPVDTQALLPPKLDLPLGFTR